MPLEYDLQGIKDWERVCFQIAPPDDDLPADEGWQRREDGYLMRVHPCTQALILSANSIRLPSLTRETIDEWQYRLDSLFDAGVAFVCTDTHDGPIPVRIRRQDLHDHVGLSVDTPRFENKQFDAYVRKLRMTRQLKGNAEST